MIEFRRRKTLDIAIDTGREYQQQLGMKVFLKSHFLFASLTIDKSPIRLISTELGLCSAAVDKSIQDGSFVSSAYSELSEQQAAEYFLEHHPTKLLDILHVFLWLSLEVEFQEFLERRGIDTQNFRHEFFHLSGYGEFLKNETLRD